MKQKVLYIIMLWFTVVLTACDGDTVSDYLDIYPISDELALGMQLDSQIMANTQEYPILQNATANAYVRAIMDEILSSPKIKYLTQFNGYSIKIVNRDDIVNAFATPGGFIYVYSGLLKFVESKAELAAVLAHEIAHCERRHSTKAMTKQYGISLLTQLVLGSDPSAWESIAANLFTNGGMLYNSRENEYEADEYSFKYLQSTKYYAGAMIYFFNRCSSQSASKPSVFEQLLSTHPQDADRIAAVEKLIKDNNIAAPTEANLFSSDYATFKAKL